ncbi:MAG: sigma 54-interacting transcriptional regulator, partial [Myxococcota bacterium]
TPERVLELLSAAPPEPGALTSAALSALAPDARQLLEAVAVVERPMPLAWFAELLDVALDARTVESLLQLGLLERTRAPQRGRLALARPALRARILAGADPARRRRLHLRCAARFADGSGPAAPHALAAGNTERAAQLALKEARALHARHAAAEGARLLEGVLDAGCSPARTGELRRALADLYGAMGHYADALPHARAAMKERPNAPDATLRLGRLLALAGQSAEAKHTLLEAHAQARDTGALDLRTAAEAELGELHQLAGEHEEARAWVERALAGAAAQKLAGHELAAWNTLGKVAFAKGELADARDVFARATKRALEADNPQRAIQGFINQAVALVALGKLQEAEPLLGRAVDMAEDVGSADGLALGTHNLALLAHLRRDYGEALQLYRRAAAGTRVVGNEGLLAQVAVNLGELFLTLGDHDRARSTLAFARRHVAADLPVYFRRNLDLLDARIERARGSVEPATAALDRAAALPGGESFELGAERVRVALMAGRNEAAAAALAALPTPSLVKERIERRVLEAQLAVARGRGTRRAADALLQAARDHHDDQRSLDAQLTAAEAYLAVGERSLAAAPLRAAQLCEERLSERVPHECAGAWLARPQRKRLEALTVPGAMRATPRGAGPHGPKHALRERYPAIVGRSPEMARLLGMIDRVSASAATVLIRGESGTGKELVAEALHRHSPRAGRPLVKVNCAALVETLLLSELFGHERGAFSGATTRRKGRFETAHGGTLFLDEIGDISPKTQVALLRVLQERSFERVGGTTTLSVDVRILAATHQDLEALVAAGKFRQDLYYRLRGIEIRTPPLRERPGDLPDLVERILARLAKEAGGPALRCTREVHAALRGHAWPGNVRELENVLRAATYFADEGVLGMASLRAVHAPCLEDPRRPESPREPGSGFYARVRRGELSLAAVKKELERECIESALAEVSGNISAAARLLGMKRPRLSQLVKEHGLRSATRGRGKTRGGQA